MNIHIHAPQHFAARRIMHCRTCRKRRRVVQLFYEWYEPLWYCTGCGEMLPTRARFKRVTTERRRKIRTAKALWQEATTVTAAIRALREVVQAQLKGER